jgi:hypothetical protein
VLRAVDRLRAGALLLAGAAVVHEGRVLAEGHGGLTRNPHDAVPFFVATAVVLTLAAGARFAAALRGGSSRPAVELPSRRALWLAALAGLVAIHLLQETLEGGLPQALAPATLVAVAIAAAVALGIALALWTAERLIASRDGARPGRPRAAASIRPRAARRIVPRPAPLARHLAGRAPPAAA